MHMVSQLLYTFALPSTEIYSFTELRENQTLQLTILTYSFLFIVHFRNMQGYYLPISLHPGNNVFLVAMESSGGQQWRIS